MGPSPDGGLSPGSEDADIERLNPKRPKIGRRTGTRGDEMSASTRTIQQPIGKGSIFGAVAMAAAVLLAALAISWGATNLIASRSVATPVKAPLFLDKGSRGDLVRSSANAAYVSAAIADAARQGHRPVGDMLKDDVVIVQKVNHGYLSAAAAAAAARTTGNGGGSFRAQ
jgi:hypothetical protein